MSSPSQPWWLTLYLHVSCFARFIGDDETYNDILFVFFEYFDCTENTVRIWICIVTWKIKPFSIFFALVLSTESSQKCTKESWEDRRIHFCDFGRRNFIWHWLEKSSVFCLSMMIARATFWKAFRTGVANISEGDIMNHVLVLEMFQRFSNLFKQTNHVLM